MNQQGLKHLADLEQLTLTFAGKLQGEFLELASAQLMDMADRAKSNDQQWNLMQLARDITARKTPLADIFKKTLQQGFSDFRQGKLEHKIDHSYDMESDLSLLANDELEQNLAATSLARKAETRMAETLYSLNQRLAVINGGKKLIDETNPVGAYLFATALQSVITELKLDTRLSILFFRIFEKLILEQMPDFYLSLNNTLIKAGILPNLRYGKAQNPERTGRSSTTPDKASAETAAAAQEPLSKAQEILSSEMSKDPIVAQQQMYDAIQNLQRAQAALSRNPTATPSAIPIQSGGQSSGPSPNAQIQTNGYQPGFFSHPGFAFDGNAAVAVCPPQEVITALANIPIAHQVEELQQTIVQPMTVEQYQSVTMHVRQELGDDKRIGDEQGKLIDIVGMIFEYMLGDKQLPDPVKAVLSYLHTPYLKMALIEGDLLNNEDHPSRLLLDCLAEAGTKWVSPDGTSQFKAFPKIKSIIRRIILEFGTDASLFSELLAEMQEFNHKVENNIALVERRSREKAEGEDRLREVKRRVLMEVRTRMKGHDLPAPVIVLLLHPWSDYLTFSLLRHGEESSQWQEGIGAISDIIWSIQPKVDINERNRLMLLQEPLQMLVHDGLETIAYDQSKSNKLIDALHKSQMLALQNQVAEPVEPARREVMEADALKDIGGVDNSLDENITSDEAELVEKLRTIEFGTWMEFDQLDELHNQRLKVAWFNAQTSRYMLVDRSGKQIATKSGLDIARIMLASQARMLSGSSKPFFERALENIFARLKLAMAR